MCIFIKIGNVYSYNMLNALWSSLNYLHTILQNSEFDYLEYVLMMLFPVIDKYKSCLPKHVPILVTHFTV